MCIGHETENDNYYNHIMYVVQPCELLFIAHLAGIKCLMCARGRCNDGHGYVIYEPKTNASRNGDCYYIIQVHLSKTQS